MKRTIAILIMAGVIGLAVLYNVRARTAPPPAADRTTAQDEVAVVSTAVARLRTMTRSVTLTGLLRADAQAAISPRAPARIRQIVVHEGQRVNRGQPLVLLEMADLQAAVSGAAAGIDAAQSQYRKALDGRDARSAEMAAQVSQAQAGVEIAQARLRQAELGVSLNDTAARSDAARADAGVRQAEAGVRQAEIGAAQAGDMVRRLRRLYERGGIAKADLEGAEAQAAIADAQRAAAVAGLEQARAGARPASESVPLRRAVSEADVRAARAGVRQAEQGLQTALKARAAAMRIAGSDVQGAGAQVRQARAGHTQASAAIGGSVLTSPVDGYVSGLTGRNGEYAQPGMAIMTIVSGQTTTVEAAVPARDASAVRVGMPARVSADAGAGNALEGQVTRVGGVAAQDTRTVPVEIRLRPAKRALVPGSMARVTVVVRRTPNAVAVPIDALTTDGDATYVWTVVEGKARRRAVRLGAVDGAYAEIAAGVSRGDVVILTAPDILESGMAVRAIAR